MRNHRYPERAAVGLLWFAMLGAQAQEYQESEDAAPESAVEIDESLGTLGRVIRRGDPRVIFKNIDDWRKEQGPFLRDSALSYNFRTYYFDAFRQSTEPETWAAGGELAYKSGKWKDFLQLGVSWYGSWKLSGNSDSADGLLLDPEGEDISVIGQAYVTLEWRGLGARFYRQELNLPYLNRFDNRMIPNTFEAYLVGSDGPKFDFAVGQVDKIKLRNRDEFVDMSQAAGVPDVDRGVTVAAFRWGTESDTVNIGGTNQLTKDLYNTFYAEANITPPAWKRFGLKLSAQYTDQRSSGDELLGEFETNTWGVRLASSVGSFVTRFAFTQTDDGGTVLSPFGGKPTYLSMMVRDFDRANERAWRAGASYYFNRFGLKDVSVQFDAVRGSDAIDPVTGQPLRNQSEYDYTLDYKPTSGFLEGFWFRARYANVREKGLGKVTDELRIIVNYTLPIL